MAHPSSIFIIKVIWLSFLLSQQANLVTCDPLDDDSLQNALEAIERRQRNLQLQESDYYGQPENIGYGFQKNFGFFDDGPATELGSPDSLDTDSELEGILSYLNSPRDEEYDVGEKRRSSFRERNDNSYLLKSKEADGAEGTSGIEYLQVLRGLWNKYRKTHPDEGDLEDVTDEDVEEMLRALSDGRGEDYEIPARSRRNYRVFDHISDRKKRYPLFGEGLGRFGKRSLHAQHVGYEAPPENDFVYSLKYASPEGGRYAVEVLRDGAFQAADERDSDVVRLLAAGRQAKQRPEQYDPGVWMQEPVYYPEEYEERKYSKHPSFKQHNGLHLNRKRFPVKRSATDEKVTKELKGIFGAGAAPKKKAVEPQPKNATKPEVTKHAEVKKVVRRAEPSKEEVPASSSDIADLFHVKKKSIDWSQYFGLDKRGSWLRDDSLHRAQSHLLAPKRKRFSRERANVGNVNFLDQAQYEVPFDTRVFNTHKRFSYDMDRNIQRMENKIGSMEEKMIDEAVSHSGQGGPGRAGQAKSDVMHRLEAAYSLEKMKSALEDFKNSMKTDKHFGAQQGGAKPPVETTTVKAASVTGRTDQPVTSEKPDPDKEKRVAVKKEFKQEEPADGIEFLNWPLGEPQADEECPVLERMLHNCLRVEELAGPYTELLLPICSLQQICYSCGSELGFSRPSSCDLVYLTEAQNLCQGDSECLLSARDSMLALRDMHEEELVSNNGRHLAYGACAANPCIQRYFLTSPGAVVPLEFQN